MRVSRTKAGRKGKTVTLVTGIPPADLAEVGKELRRFVGSGGSVKEGVVEIQGDHRDRIADCLRRAAASGAPDGEPVSRGALKHLCLLLCRPDGHVHIPLGPHVQRHQIT